MYPFVRMLWQLFRHRNDPKLPWVGTHVSQHYCMPWDLDLWMELNNGRTLTLYDLNRIPLLVRTGLASVLKEKKWGMTIAGTVIRYRRRVRMFDKVELRSRAIGWDNRFMYLEQSMWNQKGECTSHAVLRAAATSVDGIVPPSEIARVMGHDPESPEMPEWVVAWKAAEDMRPWPPMQD